MSKVYDLPILNLSNVVKRYKYVNQTLSLSPVTKSESWEEGYIKNLKDSLRDLDHNH